jgi:predicted membrane protein
LTLGAIALWCLADVNFFEATFRGAAFFGTRLLAIAFFLTATFFVDLGLTEVFAFDVFRAGALLATALFAFGRAFFAAATRLLAADLGVGRRAIVREVERLKPLVTALISKAMVKGQCGPDTPEVAVAE